MGSRLPFERQGDACLEFTPTPLRNLSQHRFEPILADELRAAPGAELRYGHQWERSDEVDDAVVSEVTDAPHTLPLEPTLTATFMRPCTPPERSARL